MKDFSKEDLIGYVLGALEPGEERRIEYALQSSTELRNQLADVEDLLAKMPDRFTEIDPPESLTQKTINTIGIVDDSMRQLGTENIAVNRGVESSAEEIPAVTLSDKASSGNKRKSNKTGSNKTRSNKTRSNKTLSENKESSFNYRRNWSAADVLVGCAVCLLIAVVLLPSISKSRFQAQRLQCQDNLRAIGYKFANVADSFEGRINLNIPGNQLSASQYVEKLILADVLNCEQFVCPSDPEKEETIRLFRQIWSSPIVDSRNLDPSMADEQYLSRTGSTIELPVKSLTPQFSHAENGDLGSVRNSEVSTGSYGFPVPTYRIASRKFDSIRVPSNVNQVLCADGGCFGNPGFQSRNHSGKGQNVLLGDLSVSYISTAACLPTGDHIYTNSQGEVRPGFAPNDNLIIRGSIYIEYPNLP